MPPKLTKVVRLDSMPISNTGYTAEGYLQDRPILTSTGVFEYRNPDGSIRRELRLPEEVFAEQSLVSYKGKPIIITHDAGLVTKDNVGEHQIGTILTDGYRSGDDVRAEIVIHQTDEMRRCGLKELSLGYDLDLEEVGGEWNGIPYDAIQRNIRINHLALVREARAGDQARLNIDSRDSNTILKGGKAMKKTTKNALHADGVLSPEELAKAIEEYKARRAAEGGVAADEGDVEEKAVPNPASAADNDAGEDATVEEKVALIKERNNGDNENVETVEEAKETIERKDCDINTLFDIIDTLLAERDFGNADACKTDEGETKPADDETANADGDEESCDNAEGTPAAEENADEDEDKDAPAVPADVKVGSQMNADAVDAIVSQKIQLGMLGRTINLDGLETMPISEAKKAIVMAVRPNVRLDGKGETYIDAMFDFAVAEITKGSKKDTSYQKKQMFNKDSRADSADADTSSANDARQRMIERRTNKEAK